jgi:hypothetical protein
VRKREAPAADHRGEVSRGDRLRLLDGVVHLPPPLSSGPIIFMRPPRPPPPPPL